MPPTHPKSTSASRRGRSFRVAVFGKHPAWDDHIDDIGMTSERLVWVRRVLYTEGIAGNIDSGAWENLEDDRRLPGYRHLFLWRTPDGLVVGRLWSSRDGKGRDKYPMVACVHMEGWDEPAPVRWALEEVLPRLERLQAQCEQAQSQSAVRLAAQTAQEELDAVAAGAPSSADAGAPLTKLLEHPDLGNLRIGLMRILYEAERELGAFRGSNHGGLAANLRPKTVSASTRAQHLRVPRCAARPGDGAMGWMALFGREIGDRALLLVVEPEDQRYADVIVGEADPAALFCVRASEKGLPLTSDVPYTLSEDFLAAASRKIDSWLSGDSAPVSIPRPTAPKDRPAELSGLAAAPVAVTTKSRPRVGLMVVAAVILAAAVGAYFVFFGKKDAGPGSANAVPPSIPEPSREKPNRSPEPTPKPPPGSAVNPAGNSDSKPAATNPAAGDSPSVAAKSDSAPSIVPKVDASKTGTSNAGADASIPYAAVSALTGARFESGDPRSNWKTPADFEAARVALERLAADMKDEKLPAPGDLSAALGKARERIESVAAMKFSAANKDSIERNMASADESIGAAKREIDSASARGGAKLSEFLASAAARKVSRVEALNEAWRSAIAKIDGSQGRAAAVARVAAIEAAFTQSEAAFAPAASGTPLPLDGFDSKAATAAVLAKREVALGMAARSILSPDPESIRAAYANAGGSFEKWFAAAKALLDSAAVARQRLASGFGFDEPGPDGVSIARILANCESSPAYADLAGAISPVLDDARTLAQVPETDDPRRLAAYLKQRKDKGPLSHMLAAWKRLSELKWPDAPSDLREAGELRAVVAAFAEKVEDSARRDAASRSISAASRAMWSRFARDHGADSASLKAAMDAMPALGVSEAELAALPDWVRFNGLKARFAGEIDALSTLRAKEQAAPREAAITAFRRAVAELGPGIAARPEVSALLGALDGASDKAADLDLSKFGPGAAAWKLAAIADDGSVVSYEATLAGKPHRVEFRRVPMPDGEAASYVATNEVSLSLFAGIITGANKWDEARPLLRAFDPRTDDPREGPRVWTWSARPAEPILSNRAPGSESSLGWLKSVNTGGVSYYPPKLWPEGGPASPSAEHPMQQVSCRAAALAAKAAGCRFPTSGEWKSAAAMESHTKNNLRDERWRQQHEHVKMQVKVAAPEYPAAGCFWPKGVSRVSPASDAEVTATGDDGWLWFAPVNEGGGESFRHIRGNVAEFVLESATEIERAEATRTGMIAALGRGEQLRVIGGSALSSPRIKVEEPQAVEFGQALEGWSDVGFRLAFSAPKGAATGMAGVERLKKALASSPDLKDAGYK